jgi:4-hydroxy-2-oxoheptanedioate aldolase
MRKNFVKEKIQAGQPSFGIGFLSWPSLELVEFAGYLGFEWLWICVEHSTFDLQTIANMARASEISGIIPFARIHKTSDPEQILGYMEAGMMGIVTPHVICKEDVELVVRAVKFHPAGTRSAGLMRPAKWGIGTTSAEYYEASNRETMVIALVEEKEGIDNLDEILRVEGLDAVCLGPGDLSLSMGYPGQKTHPEVLEVLQRGWSRVMAAGKPLMVDDGEGGKSAAQWRKEGALLIRCVGQQLLATGCKAWLKTVRD